MIQSSKVNFGTLEQGRSAPITKYRGGHGTTYDKCFIKVVLVPWWTSIKIHTYNRRGNMRGKMIVLNRKREVEREHERKESFDRKK